MPLVCQVATRVKHSWGRLTSQAAGHAWGSARLISIVRDFAQLRYFAFGPGPTPGVLWWY